MRRPNSSGCSSTLPFTSGTSAKPQELLETRFPVYVAGRGGQFTYHGPGQRVGYVMLDLKRRAPDVRRFVATIEEWTIRTLGSFGVRGERREDRVGVWVARRQRRRRRGQSPPSIRVSVVGDAARIFNVAPDLSHFAIVPCASQKNGVTSLADLGRPASMPDVDRALRAAFEPLFGTTIDAQDVASTENRSPGRRNAKSAESASR